MTLFDKAHDGDWIAFVGSVLGALLGGLATLIALLWTLRYYRQKDNQQKLETEEKNRLSVIPYLTANDYLLTGVESPYNVYFHSSENGTMNDFSCVIQIKNVGLGTAVNVTFPKLYPMRNENVDDDNITIPVDDSIIINLQADIRTDKSITNIIWMTIMYYDLLGNRYQQNLSLDINYDRQYIKAAGTLQPEMVESTNKSKIYKLR